MNVDAVGVKSFSIKSKAVFRHRLLFWYRENRTPHPWRLDWQHQQDPFTVWLSEVMLQQTVIKAVLPVYRRFLNTIPDVYALAEADEALVRQLVRGLGYYRRFAMMHRAAKELVARSGDTIAWPTKAEAWMNLPGIGRYTSAAVASIAFNEAKAVVDGNVERVICRLDDVRKPVNAPELKPYYYETAQALLDAEYPGDFNQAMMELGQRVCTPTKPRCPKCPVQEFCLSYKHQSQDLAPQAKLRKKSLAIELCLYIVEKDEQIAILPRSQSAKFLKGTYGFLTMIHNTQDGGTLTEQAIAEHAIRLGSIRHTITNHKITAHVYWLNKLSEDRPEQKWLKQQDVEQALISNLDRKAWILYAKRRQEVVLEKRQKGLKEPQKLTPLQQRFSS